MDAKELLKEKAGYILSRLMGSGGQYGEIFYERSRICRMHLEDNRIQKIQWGIDEGVGLRLIKDGNTYYGYTTNITFENLMELAKLVSRGEDHGPIAIGKIYRKSFNPVLLDPDQLDLSYRKEILLRANDAARRLGGRIKQVTAVLMDKTRDIMVINTLGERAEDLQKRVVFFTEVVASDGQQLQRGYESLGGTKGFEIFEEKPPEMIAEIAARRALLLLEAKPAPAGSFTVVMSAQAGGTMIHEAVGHGLEADLVQKGLSVYAGKLGERVASPLVTVLDDATLEGLNGSFGVDDEGVPAQRKVLIENGYLVGFMYDRMTALKEGKSSTGNGRRQSYAHIPIVRMTNTFIQAGDTDPQDIIKDTKKGVLVVKMGGGEVNTVTGDFVFEVMEGYLIENGEITYPIKSATLIGNGPKALQDVDAVGRDLGWAIGTCGKDGQGVPVSDAQPTIRIRSLVVGGTEVIS